MEESRVQLLRAILQTFTATYRGMQGPFEQVCLAIGKCSASSHIRLNRFPRRHSALPHRRWRPSTRLPQR